MLIAVPFISSTGLAIVVEADLLCGIFLSKKSCHKLVVSTTTKMLLVLVTECFFSFDIFEIRSAAFFDC